MKVKTRPLVEENRKLHREKEQTRNNKGESKVMYIELKEEFMQDG